MLHRMHMVISKMYASVYMSGRWAQMCKNLCNSRTITITFSAARKADCIWTIL